MHAHTVVGVLFVTTWQYSPLYDLLLERKGPAVQAVEKMGRMRIVILAA